MFFQRHTDKIEYYTVSDYFWKGKQVKIYPIHQKFLKRFLANNFALSNGESNTSGPLNRGRKVYLPLFRTLLGSC